MKRLLSALIFFTVGLLYVPYLYSVPAYPYPIEVKQPDGSSLTIYLKGDEFFNFKTTLDGYLISQGPDGYYSYALADETGNISATDFKAHNVESRTEEEKSFLTNLNQNPDFQPINQQNRQKKQTAQKSSSSPIPKKFPLKGKVKSLVILVSYQDVTFSVENPQQAFTRLLNENGYSGNGGTGSARDYFRDASMGEFDPEFVVIGPYTLPENRGYYGGNEDENAPQMVKDACRLAYEDGLDFSQFDTDNDGYVDNIFIYYAGHNRAEGGPSESVWPHRYAVWGNGTQYGGIRVYDYACTSELRSKTGINMCGIGTFVHEFGHVLGLPDYYNTGKLTSHETLESWNTMDSGSYLNEGRTPPTYSAYDRFYLGWMTPIELKEAQKDIRLEMLATSNTAYLVSKNNNHNMNGASPDPTEFIMLENRQKTGWDKYLPGHGLYITRVNYDEQKWDWNTVNNDPKNMGYSLIKAVSKGTSGYPFPGTENINTCLLTLKDGTDLQKPILNIQENDDIITFQFMEFGIVAHGVTEPFTATYTGTSKPQTVEVKGVDIQSDLLLSFEHSLHFEMKGEESTSEWSKTLTLKAINNNVLPTNILIRLNPASPLYGQTINERLIIASQGEDNSVIELSGNIKRPVYVVPPIAATASEITDKGFIANWNNVSDATGYYITLLKMVEEGTATLREGFSGRLTAPSGWTIQAQEITTTKNQYGTASPAIKFTTRGEYIETEYYPLPVRSFSFLLNSIASTGTVTAEAFNGKEWIMLDQIRVSLLYKATKQYEFEEKDHYSKFRITYKTASSGAVSIDDVTVSFGENFDYLKRHEWTTETTSSFTDLTPDFQYIYSVQATDKTMDEAGKIIYENITPFSNLIYVSLMPTNIDIIKENNNLDFLREIDTPIHVFNILGQQVTIIQPDSNSVLDKVDRLPKGYIYILQAGKNRIKIAL